MILSESTKHWRFVSLDSMKTELRIPISETAHDVLLAEQIRRRVSEFRMESTGLALS